MDKMRPLSLASKRDKEEHFTQVIEYDKPSKQLKTSSPNLQDNNNDSKKKGGVAYFENKMRENDTEGNRNKDRTSREIDNQGPKKNLKIKEYEKSSIFRKITGEEGDKGLNEGSLRGFRKEGNPIEQNSRIIPAIDNSLQSKSYQKQDFIEPVEYQQQQKPQEGNMDSVRPRVLTKDQHKVQRKTLSSNHNVQGKQEGKKKDAVLENENHHPPHNSKPPFKVLHPQTLRPQASLREKHLSGEITYTEYKEYLKDCSLMFKERIKPIESLTQKRDELQRRHPTFKGISSQGVTEGRRNWKMIYLAEYEDIIIAEIYKKVSLLSAVCIFEFTSEDWVDNSNTLRDDNNNHISTNNSVHRKQEAHAQILLQNYSENKKHVLLLRCKDLERQSAFKNLLPFLFYFGPLLNKVFNFQTKFHHKPNVSFYSFDDHLLQQRNPLNILYIQEFIMKDIREQGEQERQRHNGEEIEYMNYSSSLGKMVDKALENNDIILFTDIYKNFYELHSQEVLLQKLNQSQNKHPDTLLKVIENHMLIFKRSQKRYCEKDSMVASQ